MDRLERDGYVCIKDVLDNKQLSTARLVHQDIVVLKMYSTSNNYLLLG